MLDEREKGPSVHMPVEACQLPRSRKGRRMYSPSAHDKLSSGIRTLNREIQIHFTSRASSARPCGVAHKGASTLKARPFGIVSRPHVQLTMTGVSSWAGASVSHSLSLPAHPHSRPWPRVSPGALCYTSERSLFKEWAVRGYGTGNKGLITKSLSTSFAFRPSFFQANFIQCARHASDVRLGTRCSNSRPWRIRALAGGCLARIACL